MAGRWGKSPLVAEKPEEPRVHLYVTREELTALINAVEHHQGIRAKGIIVHMDYPYDDPTLRELDEKLVRIADNLHR